MPKIGEEGLEENKQTPGSQDDSGKGGEGGLDTEGLTERQLNQVAGLKNALNARDADISLIEEHGLRFVADKSYLLELPEDVGRKLIDRLKRTKSISIDMEYDDIVADLNGGGAGGVDPNKVADLAVKRMTAIQDAKETDTIISKALGEIEDTELKTRFQQDYAELSGGKKLAPAVAKKLTETILNNYRFEIQSQQGARNRALGMGSSGINGTRMPGPASAQTSSKKNYDIAVANGWSEADLAKYYPEFHTPKK